MTYSLCCFSFDGDYVIEGAPFRSIRDAWKRCNEMGSRWFFYPIPIVISQESSLIVDCCDEIQKLADLRGKSVEEFKGFLSDWQPVIEAMFE